jgi:hypothetical protein
MLCTVAWFCTSPRPTRVKKEVKAYLFYYFLAHPLSLSYRAAPCPPSLLLLLLLLLLLPLLLLLLLLLYFLLLLFVFHGLFITTLHS